MKICPFCGVRVHDLTEHSEMCLIWPLEKEWIRYSDLDSFTSYLGEFFVRSEHWSSTRQRTEIFVQRVDREEMRAISECLLKSALEIVKRL
jgi:hypothetical protein